MAYKEAKNEMVVCPVQAMLSTSITISCLKQKQRYTLCTEIYTSDPTKRKQHFDQEFLYYGYFPFKKGEKTSS